jgi:hypothetical protein
VGEVKRSAPYETTPIDKADRWWGDNAPRRDRSHGAAPGPTTSVRVSPDDGAVPPCTRSHRA